MPKFLGLATWSDLPRAGGARLRFIPELDRSSDGCKVVLSVEQEESLTAEMPKATADAALVDSGVVLQELFSDGSCTWWRIESLTVTRTITTVVAKAILNDLADKELLVTVDEKGFPQFSGGLSSCTATEAVDFILADDRVVAAGIPDWLKIGTIDSTKILDSVQWDSTGVLGALRTVQAAVRNSGEACELDVHPDPLDNTWLVIDLVAQINGAADPVSLVTGKNLVGDLANTSSRRDQSTVVITRGAAVGQQETSIGLSRWIAATITGTGPYVVTLTDPANGVGPIGADDQWNGQALWHEKTNTYFAISDCSASAQTVTLASIGAIVAGDVVQFRTTDSSTTATPPIELTHPARVALYGRKVGTYQRNAIYGVPNFVANALQRTWSNPAHMPDGWGFAITAGSGTGALVANAASGSSTIMQNTDPLYTKLGGNSIQFALANGAMIVTPPAAIAPWYTGLPMSVRIRLFLTAWPNPGAYLQLALGIQGADDRIHIWGATDRLALVQDANDPQARPAPWQSIASNQFIDLALEDSDVTIAGTGFNAFFPTVSAADVAALAATAKGIVAVLTANTNGVGTIQGYYDAAFLSPSESAIPADGMTEFGGANILHQTGNLILGEVSQPVYEIKTSVLDLERLNPGTFSAELLKKGAPARIIDPAVNPADNVLRMMQLEPDRLIKANTTVTFASRKRQFTNLLLQAGGGALTSSGPVTSSSGGATGSGTTGSTGTSGTGSTGTGGSGSSGDTIPPLSIALAVTLDGSNVPTATASVNEAVTRVKIAGRTDRYPTADEIRAAISITPAPFSATFTALGDGATEYCAALAYDAAGNESALALASATAALSDALPVTGVLLHLKRGTGLFTDAGITPVSADGDLVYQWNDQSGNGYHATQTSSAHRPTWAPGTTQRGTGTVRFGTPDGAGGFTRRYFALPDALAIALNALTEAELFCVFKNEDVNHPVSFGRRESWILGTAAAPSGAFLPFGDGLIYETAFSSVRRGGYDPVIELNADWNVYDVWGGANDYGIVLNGTTLHTDATNTYAVPASGLMLGTNTDGGIYESAYWHLSSFIIFPRKLNSTERAAMLAYLSAGTASGLSPTLSYVVAGGDVVVTVTAPGADSVKVDASTSATPSDATVRATTELTSLPFSKAFPAPTGTDVLHVKAFSYAGATESAAVTLDISPESVDQSIKDYVDGKLAGLSWKHRVRAATTAAGTLATDFENGDAIDGVTLATGDRILIKDQAAASENGIYTVNASGAPTRATDANVGADLVDAAVYVAEGTTNADTQWVCTTNDPITLGTTAIVFAQFATGGALTVKDEGSTLSSAVTSIDFTGAGVAATNVGGAVTVNVPGGSGGWTLANTTTISSAVAQIDVTGLAGTDILLIARLVTTSVAGVIGIVVSVNNGVSYYTTSGDYVILSSAGAESNQTSFCGFHTGLVSTARSGVILLPGSGVNGGPKASFGITASAGPGSDGNRLFVASTLPINAVRILNANGGNLTAGTIYVFTR